MDFAKLAKSLDDEWFRRKRLHDTMSFSEDDRRHHRIIGDIAFMLRDAVVTSLTEEERARYNNIATP